MVECKTCTGTGLVWTECRECGNEYEVDCDDCQGTGELDDEGDVGDEA